MKSLISGSGVEVEEVGSLSGDKEIGRFGGVVHAIGDQVRNHSLAIRISWFLNAFSCIPWRIMLSSFSSLSAFKHTCCVRLSSNQLFLYPRFSLLSCQQWKVVPACFSCFLQACKFIGKDVGLSQNSSITFSEKGSPYYLEAFDPLMLNSLYNSGSETGYPDFCALLWKCPQFLRKGTFFSVYLFTHKHIK